MFLPNSFILSLSPLSPKTFRRGEKRKMKRKMSLEKIEKDGHLWVFTSRGFDLYERCVFCGMRYDYYLQLKRASEEQPEREDLKEWLKCKGVKSEK